MATLNPAGMDIENWVAASFRLPKSSSVSSMLLRVWG
jgi:hypothetical protein